MRLASSGGRRLSVAALDGRNYEFDREVITRKELAAAARDAMKALDLRPTLRLVLAELVGCWGEKLIGDRIMVWPSNEYLMQRTGLSERAVRYGIRGVVDLRLVTPKDSANGKRFAIKKNGEVHDAFGFDLTPVAARLKEWADLLEVKREEQDRIRRLFDQLTIHKRAVEEVLAALTGQSSEIYTQISDRLQALVARLPVRRKSASEQTLVELLDALSDLRTEAEQVYYDAACGGKPCPHIETSNDSIQDRTLSTARKGAGVGENPSPPWAAPELTLIREACPSLFDYPRPIETEADLVAAGRYLRGSLGAHESAWNEACEAIGPVRAAIVVAITLQLHTDDVANGANQIKNPGGYFRALMRLVAGGRMNLQTELLTMRRRKLM